MQWLKEKRKKLIIGVVLAILAGFGFSHPLVAPVIEAIYCAVPVVSSDCAENK